MRFALASCAAAAALALFPLPARSAEPLFAEVPPSASGIRWVHDNAVSPARYLPETMGPGVAFLDFDNDGWMDLFLVNSGPSDFYKPARAPRHALYRNNRNGTFSDVTAASGIPPAASFGMGAAAADFDNDGFPDLAVTAYGRAVLYRNTGKGAFTDVTSRSGVAPSGWTTSAAWLDYDGDGRLDLFLCGFVAYTRQSQAACTASRGGKPGYCIPRMFRPAPSYLYRNLGNGAFRDTAPETGIARRLGKALGVVATDIDNDRRLDLFVANDTLENFLFANRGPKGWEDIALGAMVALSRDGAARSGMGVDAGDIDGDGRQDLFVSNLDREMASLYRNTGFGMFDDLAFAGALGRGTYYFSGWGAKLFDFDNDGATDLILANGHPDDTVHERDPRVRYREPILLFRQRDRQLVNVSAEAGPAFSRDYSARGLAVGDYDNDGRLDVLIGVNGGPPLLLRNQSAPRTGWTGVRLRGVVANRDAVGARIVWSAAGVVRSRLKTAGGSYLSSHDPREILPLGTAPAADWVEVRWPAPSTRVERFPGLPSGRYVSLTEGEGSPTDPAARP